MANRKNPTANLKGNKFKKAPQGLDEAKSKGQIEVSIKKNLIETLRTNISDTSLVSKIVEGVNREVENGVYKNGIELLKIAKEPEDKTINLNGGLEVQKVFIDEKTKKSTDEHIDKFLNDWHTIHRS